MIPVFCQRTDVCVPRREEEILQTGLANDMAFEDVRVGRRTLVRDQETVIREWKCELGRGEYIFRWRHVAFGLQVGLVVNRFREWLSFESKRAITRFGLSVCNE
jgi:hypothetical protein